MFTPDPIQRPHGPPASSTPLGDYLSAEGPGVDGGYAVLPRSLAENMPLPWQQQMRNLLAEFHQAYGYLQWPVYRVIPSRYERLADLDEDQLAEVGCTIEVGDAGDLEYRLPDGRRVGDPENHQVLVSCLDPIPRDPPDGQQPAPAAPPPQLW